MSNLHNIHSAIEFYDQRYEEGYMEEWESAKKEKVKEIIRSLHLPATGKALDFGCGNGVFTNILKQELPEWEIYGVEISPTAIENAKLKFPNCNFFGIAEAGKYQHFFELVFSHHVIEHVQNLEETFGIIDSYLKPCSYQLHILPCGNQGSLEHKISSLKKNGIDASLENRFFFEEPGHLRRMTSDEFVAHENKIGFKLTSAYYTNQYEGAINWITKSSPRFVKKLTDESDAISPEAKTELLRLRKKLLPLTYLQFPYSKYLLLKQKWHKSLSDYAKLAALYLPSLISKKYYDQFDNKAQKEWEKSKHDPNGSEMFLFFKREGS
jgi:trans-aconitate methyltransferase